MNACNRSAECGRVSAIETMGLVDGPGVRTVVFLQGCPLRCACCHNPDTWNAAGGTLASQWKEYFYCESIPENVMAVKGQRRVSGRSSNTKGSENIISNGSVVAVADGQCMIIVDQGKVAELCAVPGEFVYDSSTEPTIFSGELGTSILAVSYTHLTLPTILRV